MAQKLTPITYTNASFKSLEGGKLTVNIHNSTQASRIVTFDKSFTLSPTQLEKIRGVFLVEGAPLSVTLHPTKSDHLKFLRKRAVYFFTVAIENNHISCPDGVDAEMELFGNIVEPVVLLPKHLNVGKEVRVSFNHRSMTKRSWHLFSDIHAQDREKRANKKGALYFTGFMVGVPNAIETKAGHFKACPSAKDLKIF